MRDAMCKSCKVFGRNPGMKRKNTVKNWQSCLVFQPYSFWEFSLISVCSIWKDNRKTNRMWDLFDLTLSIYRATHCTMIQDGSISVQRWIYVHMNAVSLSRYFLFILSYAKFSRGFFCLFWQSKYHLNTVSQNQSNYSKLIISAVNSRLKMGNSRCIEEPQQPTTGVREGDNSLTGSAGKQSGGVSPCSGASTLMRVIAYS